MKPIAKSSIKSILATALLLFISACDDAPLPQEYLTALEQINGTWDAGCQENPRMATDPDSPVGYFRETLTVRRYSATQTFEYYLDANCTVPVNDNQVANTDETVFLQKQTQRMAVGYPQGTTSTAIGPAFHINLQVISVAVDDVVLTEEQLQEQRIELVDLEGIYIVTESDRLHLGTATDNRPDTVPLDYFYQRVN